LQQLSIVDMPEDSPLAADGRQSYSSLGVADDGNGEADPAEWHYHLPEEPTCHERTFYPVNAGSAFLSRIRGNFGPDFVWMLFSAYFGVKGSLFTFVTLGQLPFYQKYMKVSGVQYQIYGTIAMTPFAMKAFIGDALKYLICLPSNI
jgi:hypothetical protein